MSSINHTPQRLLLSFAFFVITGLLDAFMQQFSDTRYLAANNKAESLGDALEAALPHIPTRLPADILVLSMFVLTFVGIGVVATELWQKAILLMRMFWLTGFLYLYHALTVSLTMLPPLNQECEFSSLKNTGAARIFLNTILIMLGARKSCTNHIYCAQTMIVMSCAITWRIYASNRFVVYYAYMHASLAILFLIMTHSSYSVAIALAVVVTYAFYFLYFMLVRMAMGRLNWSRERGLEERIRGKSRWEKHDELYQSIAYTPSMMNNGVVSVVAWLDGVDIRWRKIMVEEKSWDRVVGKEGSPCQATLLVDLAN